MDPIQQNQIVDGIERRPAPVKIGKFKASRLLVKESWGLLKKDKEIMLFPVLSAVVSIGVLALLAAAIFMVEGGVSAFAKPEGDVGTSNVYYLIAFLYYLFSFFVVTFFQAGVVTIVHGRLNGRDLSFGDGFRNAMRHAGKIFIWALVAATVGIILRMIAERSRLVARLVVWLFGILWGVATFFIVPVLVLDDLSILDSIKKSAGTFKKTWGETAIMNISVGLFFGLMALLGVIVFIATLFTANLYIIAAAGVLLVLFLVALAVISSSLGAIFRVVLYEYASDGRIIEGFDPALIQNAVRQK